MCVVYDCVAMSEVVTLEFYGDPEVFFPPRAFSAQKPSFTSSVHMTRGTQAGVRLAFCLGG